MKIRITFVGFFLAAFLIGYTSFWLINQLTVSTKENTVSLLTNSEKISLKVFPKSEVEIKPIVESKQILRVFNTEGFWDKSLGQHNKRLLETGEVSNIEDLKAKSGETWFGLFNNNGKDFLRLTKISVNFTADSDFEWKKVSVKNKTNPLFLLKNGQNLREGEIKTLFRARKWQEIGETEEPSYGETIKGGFAKKFNLGNREYTLKAERGLSEKQKPILVLLLETGNKSQIVHFIYYMDDGDYVGNLYWVGDLDRDGRLDLFMDFYGYEKGGYSSALFLSSEAETGNLVKEIGYFMLGGC